MEAGSIGKPGCLRTSSGGGTSGNDRCFSKVMAMTQASRAISRGWRRLCPHCGRGPLFTGWAEHIDRCSYCGLVFERNQGDTWFFTIIGDRLPVAAIIVLIYFGLARAHPVLGTVMIGGMTGLLIWTA